jgi:outer membrane lipoprotein-sorting protein
VETIPVRRSGALARTAAAVLICAVTAAGPAAAPQTSVDDVVGRNLAAKGGLARLKAVETIRQTATLSMMGSVAAMTVYSKRPNRLRQEIRVGTDLVVNAFDGETPWIINPMMGATRAVIVAGPQADQIKEQSAFDGPLVDYKARGVTVTVEGAESAGDRSLVHLKLVTRAKQVRHLYLDSETYLDARLTIEQEKMTLEQELSDYRDVDGIKVPFKVRTSVNGVAQSEITVLSVEFNVKLDDELFRMPKGL